jgi:hypothetical protein
VSADQITECSPSAIGVWMVIHRMSLNLALPSLGQPSAVYDGMASRTKSDHTLTH